MKNHQDIMDWFPEELTDEAIYSIHLFLTEFTQFFETQYYGQIRRHIEYLKNEYHHQELDSNHPLEEDEIPF